MRKENYKVTAWLNDGDEVHANVVASGSAQAQDIVFADEQFITFCQGRQIVKVDVVRVGNSNANVDENRFALTRTADNMVVAIDLDTRLKVTFPIGRYNENNVEMLGNATIVDALTIANSLRLLAEWLQEHYPEVVNYSAR